MARSRPSHCTHLDGGLWVLQQSRTEYVKLIIGTRYHLNPRVEGLAERFDPVSEIEIMPLELRSILDFIAHLDGSQSTFAPSACPS